ncbi:S8 family serine peptidase [Kocuria sp. p3-SID1433]|uniref:S8 family peptidase n=1 Tax=unclassified Kocuria TaxID=2649579 RepID=UPI0021A4BFB5|nr:MULTISPECIES: S8 family serine peptidase [unclassified Kocuria]MCT1602016.1 S8 family serine peptidase [Kocuria sp. p3-SID1428]MCT2179528.1 S8 family serine peptidase [Kocuria sp. p3-SID1433]
MSPSAPERTSVTGGRAGSGLAAALGAAVVASGILAGALLAGPAQATEEAPLPDGPAPSVPVTDPSEVPVPEPSQPAEPTAITEAQARADEYWLEDYGVREAWQTTRGEGATIAIIDTGVDGSHPDLKGAVAGGTDVSGIGAENGQEPLGADPDHGTMVASVAAGRGHGADHAEGIIGVAPEADILAVSTALGTDEAGVRSTDEQIPDAVRWAVDNGADVINMSVGSPQQSWPESWDSAFAYAEEKDVLIVAAAGNRGNGLVQVGAPATIPSVLTVGGVDQDGQAGWDSSSQGISIAVAGPAEQLVGATPGDGYASWTGTSASAPIVAGTAALIRSEHPELSADEVAYRITASARDEGEPGKDPLYGYGVLDVDRAVTADLPQMEDSPLGSMQQWIQVHRRHDSAPSASSTTSGPALTEDVTIEAQPPEPVEPLNSTGALPIVVLAGFGLLVAVITIGAVRHIRWLLRRGD